MEKRLMRVQGAFKGDLLARVARQLPNKRQTVQTWTKFSGSTRTAFQTNNMILLKTHIL